MENEMVKLFGIGDSHRENSQYNCYCKQNDRNSVRWKWCAIFIAVKTHNT